MIYEFYKGGLYRVLWSVTDMSDDGNGSQYVVYMCMTTGEIRVRRANEFHGDVQTDDPTVAHSGVATKYVKRFRQVTS